MRFIVGTDEDRSVVSAIAAHLKERGHSVEVLPVGAWADVATRVARDVAEKKADQGIVCCWTGTGVTIAANKVRGIRAAHCGTEFEARMARAHNDANVLCLGERIVGPGLGRAIAEAFVGTAFEGGRHERRVQKIRDAEDER